MKSSLFFVVAVAIGCNTDDPIDLTASSEVVQVLAHDCYGDLPGEQVDSFTPNTGGLHVIGIGQARYTEPYWEDAECQACMADLFNCHDFDAVCGGLSGWDLTKVEPANIHVGPGVTTLVLAAPLPTRWTVTTSDDAELRKVIVTGYIPWRIDDCNDGEPSSAIVPAGVGVELLDLGSEYIHISEAELALSCNDVYGAAGMPGYCDDPLFASWFLEDRQWHATATAAFLAGVEDATGEKLGSFRGCHIMSSMTIGPTGMNVTGDDAPANTRR